MPHQHEPRMKHMPKVPKTPKIPTHRDRRPQSSLAKPVSVHGQCQATIYHQPEAFRAKQTQWQYRQFILSRFPPETCSKMTLQTLTNATKTNPIDADQPSTRRHPERPRRQGAKRVEGPPLRIRVNMQNKPNVNLDNLIPTPIPSSPWVVGQSSPDQSRKTNPILSRATTRDLSDRRKEPTREHSHQNRRVQNKPNCQEAKATTTSSCRSSYNLLPRVSGVQNKPNCRTFPYMEQDEWTEETTRTFVPSATNPLASGPLNGQYLWPCFTVIDLIRRIRP